MKKAIYVVAALILSQGCASINRPANFDQAGLKNKLLEAPFAMTVPNGGADKGVKARVKKPISLAVYFSKVKDNINWKWEESDKNIIIKKIKTAPFYSKLFSRVVVLDNLSENEAKFSVIAAAAKKKKANAILIVRGVGDMKSGGMKSFTRFAGMGVNPGVDTFIMGMGTLVKRDGSVIFVAEGQGAGAAVGKSLARALIKARENEQKALTEARQKVVKALSDNIVLKFSELSGVSKTGKQSAKASR